ncbi:Mu-like prophage major head subunit gpT family protein [Desulfovibrio sp. JY]|nr:Mu-like prophage major head subunit gpT family protein [Desulfovibrio sp. JY]
MDVINAAALSTLFAGYRLLFQTAFAAAPSFWQRVAMLSPSTTAEEHYPWLADIGGLREWLGDRVVKALALHDYAIRNKPFEKTIGIKREAIEDDTYGIYGPRFTMLGDAAARHPDTLVFELLAAGFATACYDGQYFFDTDHPVEINGATVSVSNFGGGTDTAWYLLDTTRPVKPLIFQKRKDYNLVRLDRETDENVFMRGEYLYGVDARVNVGFGFWQMAYGSKQTLDADNYSAARAAMQSFKGEDGKPLGIMPNLLVVPPSLEGPARKLLKNEYNAAGATNEWFGTADVLPVPYLA